MKKGTLDSQSQVTKVTKLLAHGRWFSLGTPASSTTKTGHHDIAEILLKVALSTINQIKIMQDVSEEYFRMSQEYLLCISMFIEKALKIMTSKYSIYLFYVFIVVKS